MFVYGECECFVMQMLYVCVLCASCGSSQCCVLHDLHSFPTYTSTGTLTDLMTDLIMANNNTTEPFSRVHNPLLVP